MTMPPRVFITLFTIAVLGILTFALPGRYDLNVRAEASMSALPEYDPALPMVQEISTSAGTFWLGYGNGRVRLSGTPASLGGCGDWRMESFGGGRIVEFHIVHENDPERVCVKKLGEEAPLRAEAEAVPETLYLILVDKEVVFAGRLSPEAPSSPLI